MPDPIAPPSGTALSAVASSALSRRGALGLLGAGAAALSLAGCGSAVTGKKDGASGGSGGKVKVGHLASSLFSPLYVADAKGYFKDAGLELELVPVKSGQDGVPMLANGQLDVMVAGFSAGMFNALKQGLKFKVVGSMGLSTGDPKRSPTALEVSTKLHDAGTITSVADLKGRKIGVAGGPGSTGGYLLATMLQAGGLGLRDVTVENLATPDQEPALTNGSVAAVTPSAPFSTSIEKAKVGMPLAVPAKGTCATGVVFSESFTGSDNAQKFFTALTKGAKQLTTDGSAQSDEIYQILAKATGQKLEVLKAAPMYTYAPDLAPLPEQLQAMQKIWMAGGQITYTDALDVNSFVEPKFAKAAG